MLNITETVVKEGFSKELARMIKQTETALQTAENEEVKKALTDKLTQLTKLNQGS